MNRTVHDYTFISFRVIVVFSLCVFPSGWMETDIVIIPGTGEKAKGFPENGCN